MVKTLARELQAEFPGRNGFSAQNLWLMRQFYVEYKELQKLQPLVGEISRARSHREAPWRVAAIGPALTPSVLQPHRNSRHPQPATRYRGYAAFRMPHAVSR